MSVQPFVIIDETRPVATSAVVEADRVRLSVADLEATLGWELKPQGFCKGSVCVPHQGRPELVTNDGVDLARFAESIGRPIVLDVAEHVAAVGVSDRARSQQLTSLRAPDFTLPDLDGQLHSLSEHRGKRVLLIAWASWCGCRYDLPIWQALHDEFKARDFVAITVALDQSADDARPWVQQAAPSHPSLIDTEHAVADLYGMINVPTMVWIDGNGEIVRANDVALTNDLFKDITGVESGPRMAAVRRWAEDGTLPSEEPEVRAQLMLPTAEEQLARTEFTLACFLHRQGGTEAAERHFQRAAELSPTDWTIRRAAMPIRGIDPMGSMEMADLMSEWIEAGRPYYRPRS